MTPPATSPLWGHTIATELAATNITATCITPGSRSTPLTLSLAAQNTLQTFVHLDERSAAYFALGRAKHTGVPTPLACTSGTAAANIHPAVIEADRARIPMLILTADRPPELHGSGANQTISQDRLYGEAVRWQQTLPEPSLDPRALRSIRTTIARAVAVTSQDPAGPVHLNIPFKKPLEQASPADFPPDLPSDIRHRSSPTSGPSVQTVFGQRTLTHSQRSTIISEINQAEAGLIVVGPMNPFELDPDAVVALALATNFPILADPLSGLRFGPHVDDTCVCGGYDAFLDPEITTGWPDPDIVLRFGASPTSNHLRTYLERTAPRQFLIDAASDWRDASFVATDLVAVDPTWFSTMLAGDLDRPGTDWTDRFTQAETAYWDYLDSTDLPHEGAILAMITADAPRNATVFVANSMPVRDLDRFGRPHDANLTVLGNRGASGIDGNTSTALGAGSTTDDHLIVVLGDLAYYHDMNGLLAIDRFDVPATIVVINNNGGGIFHMLPIESFEPPFTSHFKTPHGLDFEPSSLLYDLAFERVHSPDSFRAAYRDAIASSDSRLIEVMSDAHTSHRTRDRLQSNLRDRFDSIDFPT